MPSFRQRRPHCRRLIALRSRTVAIKAGRIMLREIAAHTTQGHSFAFETTLSGLAYLRHIRQWQRIAYHVSLFFPSLSSPEVANALVAERVKQGGHDIPDPVIRRRFIAGHKNFEERYKAIVDSWVLYDNEGDEPAAIAWSEK